MSKVIIKFEPQIIEIRTGSLDATTGGLFGGMKVPTPAGFNTHQHRVITSINNTAFPSGYYGNINKQGIMHIISRVDDYSYVGRHPEIYSKTRSAIKNFSSSNWGVNTVNYLTFSHKGYNY